MDFIYANLNERAIPVYYSGVESATAKVIIDNHLKQIKVEVLNSNTNNSNNITGTNSIVTGYFKDNILTLKKDNGEEIIIPISFDSINLQINDLNSKLENNYYNKTNIDEKLSGIEEILDSLVEV